MRRSLSGLLAAVAVGAGGCASWAQSNVPVTPEVVEVGLDEFEITLDQEVVRPGRVVFDVHNDGEIEHEVTLVALPDDVGGVQEWLDSGVGGAIPIYSTKNRAPGEDAAFAADLAAGRYGLLCVLQESADHVSHHDQGMVTDIRVGPPLSDPDAHSGSSPTS